MIKVENLSKKYGNTTVLDIDSLEIPKGQSFGLVGNNGAGKTTFISLLLDLIQPTSGSISSKGEKINETENWKPYTAAFIDDNFLIGYLTPEEYFYFVGELRGWNKEEVDQFLLKFTDFFNDEILAKRKYLRDLSKGNSKKVGIVAALIGNPEVVILDEPFANLDPTTQIRLKRLLRQLIESREMTILISSHDLQHTVDISDRVVVLEKGKVVKDILASDQTMHELEEFFSV